MNYGTKPLCRDSDSVGCQSGKGGVMSDRADYRELAAQCLRQAAVTRAPETRAILLMMAEAWMKLADRRAKFIPSPSK
jgi:hypothetical protein